MDLKTKLSRLRTQEDIVLYKWTAGKQRIANDFIFLSQLRLNTVACSGGRITFSCAAPVLFMDRGRTTIKLCDRDVLTVLDGPRKGINVLGGFLHDDEQAVPAQFCRRLDIVDERQPKWIASRLLSMGCSPVYPVSRIITPELFRISRNPGSLRPIFTTAMLHAIGGTRSDSMQELMRKFQAHLDLFGARTDDGYVISNDYIATGGCCVAAARGISVRAGSYVHLIPLYQYRAEVLQRKWKIDTGEENVISNGYTCDVGAAGEAAGDSHDGAGLQ